MCKVKRVVLKYVSNPDWIIGLVCRIRLGGSLFKNVESLTEL